MYRYHLILLLLGLSLSLAGQNFERSQFPHRSGDIIIVPKSIQDDSFLYLIDSNTIEIPKEGLTIDETNVANVISTLIGGPIVNSATTLEETVVPSAHNLFNKAKANMVIFVNSIGSETLASLPSLKILQQNGQKIAIQRTAYPQDTMASLTTLMTGHSPATHGIVNQQWEETDGPKTASSEGAARIFNVNDQITQTFDGQPLIIAASFDFEMASTLGVNTRNKFGNNYAMYWNEKTARFENIYQGNAQGLNISAVKLLAKLEKYDHIKSVFDVNIKEDFNFLAELGFLRNMARKLKTNERLTEFVEDNIPDLFSFSFSTLKALKKTADSAKFAAAVHLLDETIFKVYTQLSALYAGKFSLEVVFQGQTAYEKMAEDEELKAKLFSLLKDNVNKETFDTYFPSIYVTKSANDVCQRVREEILNEVICTDHQAYRPSVKEFVLAVAADPVPDYNPDATVFQTVLWMSIILFLFAFSAAYALCQMELPADSILYRTSAPKQHTS